MSTATDLEGLRAALRHQADVEFPAAARAGGYPVRHNHCFLRIVYDNLLGAPWREVLPPGAPAIAQLDADQLRRAIAIGRSIVDDPDACRVLNRRSLELRGKLRTDARA